MTYQFQIGTTEPGLQDLSALGVTYPAQNFSLYSDELSIPDGSVLGLGWTQASWHWDFIPKAQYDILKTYCPGKSADIFIQTLDDEQVWVVYQGKIIWPTQIEVSNNKILDFTIVFRALVEP